jgi:hypothetical protein
MRNSAHSLEREKDLLSRSSIRLRRPFSLLRGGLLAAIPIEWVSSGRRSRGIAARRLSWRYALDLRRILLAWPVEGGKMGRRGLSASAQAESRITTRWSGPGQGAVSGR